MTHTPPPGPPRPHRQDFAATEIHAAGGPYPGPAGPFVDPELGAPPGRAAQIALGVSGFALLCGILVTLLLVWPGYLRTHTTEPSRSPIATAETGLEKITAGECADIEDYVTTQTVDELQQACHDAPSTFADVKLSDFRTTTETPTSAYVEFTFSAYVNGASRTVDGQVHLRLIDDTWKMDFIDLRTGVG